MAPKWHWNTSNTTPESQESPPWEDPPIQVLISNPINKNRHPQEAAKAAYNRILDLINRNNLPINIYILTPAPHKDGKTTSACYVQEENLDIKGRLPDNTPITLAELHTIQATLVWKLSRHNTKDIIIHSDSMAALTILQNRIYKTYPEITSKIFKSAKLLHRQGTQATIHWIPSHVDLDGNEHADRQANTATSLNEVFHVEETAGAYSHLIKSHLSQQLRRIATKTHPLSRNGMTRPQFPASTSSLTDKQTPSSAGYQKIRNK